ncbi:MAG: ABC transporter substrate-binding protein [Desulfobulbaceae bacterium]|nr:ABC transporter substrate-binding protein [Desulfobulbaceae bacterium]
MEITICSISAGTGSRKGGVALVVLLVIFAAGCVEDYDTAIPRLTWYVFDEPSGAFQQAADNCSTASAGAYAIDIALLPTDADQQREQLVRRLAARDSSIDIIGMDVIWTAEFAEAGWILPWPQKARARIASGRLQPAIESATYENKLQAVPFTTNTQILWYRTDRVASPPETWEEMLGQAEALGEKGTIQAQGERYEGLTVFFTSLLASAGGAILSSDGQRVSLAAEPASRALNIMKTLALSPASDPSLATSREDQARLAFEKGDSTFMVNYTFVWPSARRNAPAVAENMGWARWPAVKKDHPSRVTIGGLNLAVGAYTSHPEFAFRAAECLASEENQRTTARLGGLPPTMIKLYDDPSVRRTFPFADTLLAALKDAVQRPRTPLYNDISLAVSRTLHPMNEIRPRKDVAKLKRSVTRALHSKGLL